MPVFVDTNVLVYTFDRRRPQKQIAASEWVDHLWKAGTGRVSFQVLHEFHHTVTRKLRPGLKPAESASYVEDLLAWNPVILGEAALSRAWDVERRHRTSFWGGLVVAAAQIAGCEILLTEDLQHDQDLDGLRVVDPFRLGPDQLG